MFDSERFVCQAMWASPKVTWCARVFWDPKKLHVKEPQDFKPPGQLVHNLWVWVATVKEGSDPSFLREHAQALLQTTLNWLIGLGI